MDDIKELRRRMNEGGGGRAASDSSLVSWLGTGIAAIMLAGGIYASLHFLTGVTAVVRFQQVAQEKGLTPNEANEFMRDVAAMMAPASMEKAIRVPQGSEVSLFLPSVAPARSASDSSQGHGLSKGAMAAASAQLEARCLQAFNAKMNVKASSFDLSTYGLTAGHFPDIRDNAADLITCMSKELRQRFCNRSQRSVLSGNISAYIAMVSYAKTSRIQSLQKETAWQLGAGASVMGIDPQATRQALDTAQRIGVDRTMLAQLKGLIAEGYLVPEDFSGVFSTMGPDLRQIFDTTRMIENRCK